MKKIKEKRPFLPIVTEEDVVRFDPEDESTFTESRLVNEVLLAMIVQEILQAKDVAEYLDIDVHELQYGLRLEAGCTFTELRRRLFAARLAEVEKEHPRWSMDWKAHAIGLSGHAALWHFLHPEYKRRYDKQWKAYSSFTEEDYKAFIKMRDDQARDFLNKRLDEIEAQETKENEEQ